MTFFSYLIFVTRPFLRYIVGLVGIALGRSLVVNAQPYLIQKIIDTIQKTPKAALFDHIYPMVLSYIGLGFCFVFLFRMFDYFLYALIPEQKRFITQELMHRMLRHSTAFYQRHFAGNLTNKVNDVTVQTPELIKIITNHFAVCFFMLVVVMVNLSHVHAHFAWALMLWLSFFMGGALWMLFSSSHYTYKAAEARSSAMGHIVDIFMNMVSIRLFARARYEEEQLTTLTKNVCTHEKARDRFYMKLHFFQGLSFSIFEAVCFWWLLKGVCQGSMTPGQFVLVFTLNLQILDQFWDLGSEIREFWEKKGYVTQALSTIFAKDDQDEGKGLPELKVTQGAISFQRVHFVYPGSAPLFQDKTLEIPGGQKVGLVGYSGSGKSTFISLILRLYDVSSGCIMIDHQDLRSISRNSLYRSIAVVPQESYLFNRSIMENIRYGRLDASDEEVFEAAHRAQIHEAIQEFPKGYDTLAGERGSNLSGGQKQRIAMARAFLKNAPILILDEATSQQDAVTERKTQDNIHELVQGKTALVIAHRLQTVKSMDRILVFDRGKIVQDGSHEALLAQDGLYQKLWSGHNGLQSL